MNNKNNILIITIAVVVFLLLGFLYFNGQGAIANQANIDVFAKCIDDSGATMYGAFWCSHCQNQKAMFGSAEKIIPYIECSLPSGNGQTTECATANISTYPTWEFADGSRLSGELSFEKLSEKTGCELPGIN